MFKLLGRVLSERRQLRRHRRVQRRAIAELTEGSEVRVVGMARPLGPVLEAPVSRRICVCFAVMIYDWHFDNSVRVIHVEQGRAPFALSEGTSRAVVDPARAQMSAMFDHTTTVRASATSALLTRLGIADRDWSKTRVLELEEAIIELDERIAVIGTATREPDMDVAAEGYRDGTRPMRWRIEPTAISDDPRLFK